MPEAGIKGRDKLLHPTISVWCNYLSLSLTPASGTTLLICVMYSSSGHPNGSLTNILSRCLGTRANYWYILYCRSIVQTINGKYTLSKCVCLCPVGVAIINHFNPVKTICIHDISLQWCNNAFWNNMYIFLSQFSNSQCHICCCFPIHYMMRISCAIRQRWICPFQNAVFHWSCEFIIWASYQLYLCNFIYLYTL